ncbi:MAG: hypothetical protein WA162_00495 [Thermodesulfobacteriota bacterium]
MKSMVATVFILFLASFGFSANSQAGFPLPQSIATGSEDHMKDMMGGMAGKEAEKVASNSNGLTKEAKAASVTAKVTYKNPFDKGSPVFKIVLDTHSASLDEYKFEDVSILRLAGKIYRASLVSSKGSGHHREAEVEFKGADVGTSKYVDFVINGVAGVDRSIFRFEKGKK